MCHHRKCILKSLLVGFRFKLAASHNHQETNPSRWAKYGPATEHEGMIFNYRKKIIYYVCFIFFFRVFRVILNKEKNNTQE